ncbi:MAG: hypothetical protein H6686_10470 [Fibrobacteria bacterium]|nr:hypothetical protein [Fibrobacteria bacterium]
MIAIILFATAEKEIPFSTLLVPISLVSIAILAVLVLEGKKVQLARGAWEEQAWGGFFQNTFQAWRGGLLDELAPWYRSTPSNYRGFQDFIANNIEIRAFRKLGGWFQALDGEFLVEVPSGNKAKPSYLLTSQRGFVKDFDEGWVSFPWNQVKRIATSREANRVEITLGNAGGDHILTSLSAPSDRSLDFLVKKQGIGMSQVREEPEPDVPRSISAVVASASTASSEDLRWLSSQGPEAVAAIVALSDRMRAGDWDLAEGVAKLCIPLGDLGGEDARRLLSTLLQIPDPTREAEIVREGAARGLERLRSRA